MADLIDRNSLHVTDLPFTQGQCQTVQDWLDMQPTVEAKPVPHAVWCKYKQIQMCSECRRSVFRRDGFLYCPHCGAKMAEEVQK